MKSLSYASVRSQGLHFPMSLSQLPVPPLFPEFTLPHMIFRHSFHGSCRMQKLSRPETEQGLDKTLVEDPMYTPFSSMLEECRVSINTGELWQKTWKGWALKLMENWISFLAKEQWGFKYQNLYCALLSPPDPLPILPSGHFYTHLINVAQVWEACKAQRGPQGHFAWIVLHIGWKHQWPFLFCQSNSSPHTSWNIQDKPAGRGQSWIYKE